MARLRARSDGLSRALSEANGAGRRREASERRARAEARRTGFEAGTRPRVHILTVARGPDRGKQIRLQPGKRYLVGSSDQAALVLTDPKVLDRHCALDVDNGSVAVQNLTANAGTFVGDKKIDRVELPPGSMFRVGDTVLSLHAARPEPKPAAPAEEDPLVGKIVGGYHIKEVVGKGGMGTVYRATQLSLHRDVALKVLAPRFAQDDAFRNLFINEARAAGQLVHPNVVQVYDAGTDGGVTYFSMEFISQGSVEEILEREGKLPWEKAILMVLEAAHGLEYAEKKQIVHRDIKPDNLMINEDGRVKIADLGLAKKGEGRGAGDEGIIGTPHFIPPEQALGKPVDHRADMYSLGATFFRMITGKTLFTGKTAKEIVLKHIQSPPPAASSVEPTVPPELDLLLSKMLAKEPERRYANSEELIHALEEICAHHGIKGAIIKKGVPKRVLIPLVILLLAAVGATVYFLFIKPPDVVRDPEADAAAAAAKAEADQARRDRGEALRKERETNARGALKDLQIEEGRTTPDRSEVYDDQATADWNASIWRKLEIKYREFADTEEAKTFTDEKTGATLASVALETANAIDKDLDTFRRTAKDRQKWIETTIADVKGAREVVANSAKALLEEHRYSAAHALLRPAAEEKPAERDPYAPLLRREWASPDGKKTPAERSERIKNEIKLARDEAAQLLRDVVPKAQSEWDKVLAEADATQPGDEVGIGKAIASLGVVVERFQERDAPPVRDLQDLAAKATTRRAALENDLEGIRERKRSADRELIKGKAIRIRTLSDTANSNFVMDLRLDKALEEIAAARRNAQTPEASEFLDGWAQRVRWMDWLLTRFRADLEASFDKQRPSPFATLEIEVLAPAVGDTPLRPVSGSLERPRTEARLEVTIKEKSARQSVWNLGALPMDSVHDGAFHHQGKPRWKEVDSDLRFALGIFCFETCQFDAARKHFSALVGDAKHGATANAWIDAANDEGLLLQEYTSLLKAKDEGLKAGDLQQRKAELSRLADKHPKTLLIVDILGEAPAGWTPPVLPPVPAPPS